MGRGSFRSLLGMGSGVEQLLSPEVSVSGGQGHTSCISSCGGCRMTVDPMGVTEMQGGPGVQGVQKEGPGI